MRKQIMNKNNSKSLMKIHQFYQKLYIHCTLEALTKQLHNPLGIM